tara:strand:+ start:812 stop:1078 length:267 start_codon:yes stop_codon:yes gene_type:complete
LEDETFNKQSINKEKASLYNSVFSTRHGNLVLEDLLKFVGYYGETFSPGDPCVTAYNCGQRRVIVRILNLLGKGNSQEIVKLHKERQS